MSSRQVLLLLVLTVWFTWPTYAEHSFNCEPDFCTKTIKSCRRVKCDKENGRLIKNATKCGCCDICIKKLRKEDKCKINEIGSVPESECGHGLECSKVSLTCVPRNTECINHQIRFEPMEVKVKVQIVKEKPECDYFGYYEPVVCIPGVLCYCVDKQGKRIFGTDLASNKALMNCNCSRDFEEFPRKNDEVSNGNFPRCLRNGNYDALQCTEDWCFCLDSDNRHYEDAVKANTRIKDLACYDEALHKEDDNMQRSRCWRERQSVLKKLKEYEDKNITVIGVDLPNCELDGSYAPVQCNKNKCFCVRRNGVRYEGFEAQRHSQNAQNMTCRCLREQDMLYEAKTETAEMNFFRQYHCDKPTGNYKSNQNIDSESFTIDEMGYQI